MKKEIVRTLFVFPYLNVNSPQGIRYKNLFMQGGENLTISLFKIREWDFTNQVIVVRSVVFTIILRLLNKLLKRLFFPDVYSLYTFLYFRIIRRLIKKNPTINNIVIAVTPFSLISLSARIKKHFPDINLILDMSDPFSFNSNHVGNESIINQAMVYEKMYFNNFDTIVVLNNKIKQKYELMYNNISFKTIEQGFSNSSIAIESSNKKQGMLTFIYAGVFYSKFRDPSNLFSVIDKSSFVDKVLFNIYGGGGIDQGIFNKYKWIQQYGRIPQMELYQQYASNDVIVFIDNFSGYQVPGKLLECLAYGKPVLFIYDNKESPSLDYVDKYEHVFMAKNNVNDIEKALVAIIDSPRDFNKPDLSQYDWEQLRNEYANIYK